MVLSRRRDSPMRLIGLAVIMYSNGEQNGGFPRTLFDANKAVYVTTAGYGDTQGPFDSTVSTNNVLASFYLLMSTRQLSPDVFICSSSNGTRGFTTVSVTTSANWFSVPDNESYSFNAGFPDTSAVAAGYKWNSTLGSDFAIALDINPGISPITKNNIYASTVTSSAARQFMMLSNSNSHKNDGQNVLYADGHVEYQKTPWAGSYETASGGSGIRDNIFIQDKGRQIATSGSAGVTNSSANNVGQPDTALDNSRNISSSE